MRLPTSSFETALAWAQALPATRWAEAGLDRSVRISAQCAGILPQDALSRLGWASLLCDDLSSLERAGVVDAMLTSPVASPASFIIEAWERSKRGVAGGHDVTNCHASWLKLCECLAAGEVSAQRWARALGGSDAVYTIGFVLGTMSTYSFAERLANLPVQNGQAVLLGALETIPSDHLMHSFGVLERGRGAWGGGLTQTERWTAIAQKHQGAFEQWFERDSVRAGRLSPSNVPRSWLCIVENVFDAEPDFIDHPAWAPTVVMSSLLLGLAQRESDMRLPKFRVLPKVLRHIGLVPTALAWANHPPGSMQAWMDRFVPGFTSHVRACEMKNRLPEPVLRSPKPRF